MFESPHLLVATPYLLLCAAIWCCCLFKLASQPTNSTNQSYQNQHHQCINQNNYRPISSSNKQPIQYQQHIACYTENERTEWILALQSASHRSMKNSLDSLRSRLRFKVFTDVFDDMKVVTLI